MKKFATGIALSALAIAMAAGVKVPADAAVAAPTISLKEQVGNGQIVTGWTFQYADLQPGQELRFNVYKNNDPHKSETGSWVDNYDYETKTMREYFVGGLSDTGTENADDTEYTISAYNLTPGAKTVVAYLYDGAAYEAAYDAYEAAYDAYEEGGYQGTAPEYPDQLDYYSPASNPIAIEVSMEAGVSTVVKAKSITMDMNDNNATGYEIYRKVGKKFKKIATVAKDTYKDNGLTAKTEYTYRVRPYYKDPDTGVITYGKYTTFKRTTKGSALQLKVNVQKKKNIKLSWKKVKGAKSYEIYRANGYSTETVEAKGMDDSYQSYTLLKTVGKKKKKFVDKKTIANEDYSYIVRAVMPKQKGVKADKAAIVDDYAYVDLSFGMPEEFKYDYTNANGDRTVEWDKVYGADGYYVMEKVISYNPDGSQKSADWLRVAQLGANATKFTFPAKISQTPDGSYVRTTEYDICAFKGNVVSASYADNYDPEGITVTKTLGLVDAVSATNVGNGVQVSWTPVPGAAYYEVYRVRAGSLVKNNDIGGYRNAYGQQVTEYVGATDPVPVDVNAVNATYETDDWLLYYRLNPAKTYYYQNYQYAQDQFTGTSMIDYTYDIYGYGYFNQNEDANGNITSYKSRDVVEAEDVIQNGPEDGVAYQYYVIAYAADRDVEAEHPQPSVVPGTLDATAVTLPKFKNVNQNTVGCKAVGSVNFTSTVKTGKAVIKSVKATGKKTATIKIKKKVNGASEYKIYRSNKKKGKYMCVGTTKKLTFKDKGLISGKTYYYKVKAVAKNASNADVDSSLSKAKSVKAR